MGGGKGKGLKVGKGGDMVGNRWGLIRDRKRRGGEGMKYFIVEAIYYWIIY